MLAEAKVLNLRKLEEAFRERIIAVGDLTAPQSMSFLVNISYHSKQTEISSWRQTCCSPWCPAWLCSSVYVCKVTHEKQNTYQWSSRHTAVGYIKQSNTPKAEGRGIFLEGRESPTMRTRSLLVIYFIHTVLCLVAQTCPTLYDPWTLACQAPLSMRILQARILEWVAMPSSRGSSQPNDRTEVCCIAGRFFTFWSAIVVCICQSHSPNLSLPQFSPLMTMFVFCIWWLYFYFVYKFIFFYIRHMLCYAMLSHFSRVRLCATP